MDAGSSVAGSDTISDAATPVASTSALKQDPSPESAPNRKPVIDLDQLERSFKTWMRVIGRQSAHWVAAIYCDACPAAHVSGPQENPGPENMTTSNLKSSKASLRVMRHLQSIPAVVT